MFKVECLGLPNPASKHFLFRESCSVGGPPELPCVGRQSFGCGYPKLACNAFCCCLGSASGRSVSGATTIFAFHAQIRTRAKSRILDLTSPLLLDPKQPLLRRPRATALSRCLQKPQLPSDGTCATPLSKGCHLFSTLFCLLPSFASRRAPSLCEFQTSVK
jgi:hypothetical protein